jgi:hypothetical protein
MINQYKTRRDVSVKAVQFDGTNRDEIERLNYFMVSPTTEDNQLFVVTTFGDGYMNVGDYLVNIADSFIVMTKATFNSLFKETK